MLEDGEALTLRENRWRAAFALLAVLALAFMAGIPLLTGVGFDGRSMGGFAQAYCAVFLAVLTWCAAKEVQRLFNPRRLTLTPQGFRSDQWNDAIAWADVEGFLIVYGRPGFARAWVFSERPPGVSSIAWRLRPNKRAKSGLADWHAANVADTDGTLAGHGLPIRKLLQVFKDWHARYG